MARKALTTIVTRHQVFLERLKTQTATNFASVLPKLGNVIAQVLSTLDTETMDQLSRRQLQKLLVELREQQQVLIAAATKELSTSLRELSAYELTFERKLLQNLLTSAGKDIPIVNVAASEAWKGTLAQPLSATGQLLEPFIATWGDKQIAGVDAAVTRAWGEGRTVQQLMQEIRGTKKLSYKDGLVDVSRRQAEAVARTSVQHVAQQARSEVWGNNSDLIEGYVFVATLDGKTTQQCRSLDGKEFALGKGPQPPVHINCRSTTIPKLPKEFDFLDKGATRSSKDGYVDADQSYYSWLKEQPEAFQNEALGASRAKLFRDGGLSAERFAELNLGKNFQPLTLDQMKQLEPLAFSRAGLD